ncbi:MAG: YbjN domain-containing protein [Mesorhizobium sp.]|nr:YbjN domain-containing protein [Mesorhizobium sp.]
MARIARVIAFAFPLVLAGLPALAEDSAKLNVNEKPEVLTKVTLEDIRDALQNAGYRAQIKNDSSGDYVSSASGGRNFFASLGGCDDQKVCKSILMETGGWTLKTPPTVEALNQFHFDNGAWITAMTYKDGKYYGDYRADLTGGVTKAWLQGVVEDFASSADTFATFMQKQQ